MDEEELNLDDEYIGNSKDVYSTNNPSSNQINYNRRNHPSFTNKFNYNKKDYNMLQQRLHKGNSQNFSKINAMGRHNEQSNNNNNDEKKNVVQNAKQQAVEKGTAVAAQAMGVPAPIANVASKALSGPIMKEFERKKRKIKIIICAVIIIIFLILIPILSVAGDDDFISSDSKDRTEYLYGSGNEQNLYNYLIDLGYCSDENSCSTSQATIFYKKIKEALDNNSNLTPREADIFIIEVISYGRENYFSHTEEIEAIASIIGGSGKFSIKNTDKYKDSFVGENGYFMTYRKDDLLKENTNYEYLDKIYNIVSKQALELSNKYTNIESSSNQVVNKYSVCSGVTVTGENAGTYDLEDYVAKVVSHENDWHPNGNLENNKVQAVAARTYVLYVTKNCTKSIESSANRQAISSEATQSAIDATKATEGEVLVDSSGNYVLTMYDAFCYTNVDNENYTLCQQGVKVPVSWVNDHISNASLEYYENHSHGKGMSQWGSRYLSTQGYTYDKILAAFYVDAKIQKLVSPLSGLVEIKNGFLKRVSRALRDNMYFYNDGAQNEGECAWYAVRRTNEILANGGINIKVTSGGNGGDFCYSSQYKNFSKVYDIQDLKPGMVISWSSTASIAGHSYGHVAIIEDVYYDSKGNVTSVDISEGSNSAGTGYNSFYNNNRLNNNYIWSIGNGDYKKQIRQLVCEGSFNGSTGSGCQKFTNVPASKIKNRWNGYKFECAIDLLG